MLCAGLDFFFALKDSAWTEGERRRGRGLLKILQIVMQIADCRGNCRNRAIACVQGRTLPRRRDRWENGDRRNAERDEGVRRRRTAVAFHVFFRYYNLSTFLRVRGTTTKTTTTTG